ncbi:MAG: site-specific integrase [Verrucomicrobiales bacterium]
MPRKKKLPEQGAPEIVREGNAQVKIYFSPVRDRPRYIVVHHGQDGNRRAQSFADYDLAKQEAEVKAIAIHNGTLETLELTGERRRAHERAMAIAGELERPLDGALVEYREARALLPEDVSLVEAARFFVRHSAGTVKKRALPDVVEDYIKQLEKDNMSKRHVEDARARLRKLAAHFDGPIDEIEQSALKAWLNQLEVGVRTRNNFRGHVVSLFKYAKGDGNLPKGLPTAAEGLRKAKEKADEPGILTPERMIQFLKEASERLIPLLAIGGFAGLRTSEIMRLQWEEIDFGRNHIDIKAKNTKTAQRRLAPLLPNLKEWLTPYQDLAGPVCSTREVETERRELAKTLNIDWPNNALRHSYASYRMASTENAPKVAIEMGNSPEIIFSAYREVVPQEAAEKWFSILPEK